MRAKQGTMVSMTVDGARSVLIVDDEPEFRTRVRQLIANAQPTTLFGEAGTGAECLVRLGDHAWDLILLDISMPGRDGLSVLREIKQLCAGVTVVMLSGLPESQYAATARRAGASAYVQKDRAADELVSIIEALAAQRVGA